MWIVQYVPWMEGGRTKRRSKSHHTEEPRAQKSCLTGAELTSAFIPFIEYPQGLNIVASITEPGIRSQIPLICDREGHVLTAEEIRDRQRKQRLFQQFLWEMLTDSSSEGPPHSSTSFHLLSHMTAVRRQKRRAAWRSASELGCPARSPHGPGLT